MEKFDVAKDIAERTGGDIYLGVVGPVRSGKSTFIKRFMESMVLPNIEDSYQRAQAVDELPQSGSGRTVMTAEPKFVPAEAVNIQLGEGIEMRVRLVDCVGYAVDGAQGFEDEDGPRMVNTPWSDQPLPFAEAAEIGTRKVIDEHSTIGVVMLADGSFGDIPQQSYMPAAERVIDELQDIGKPFVIVLNSAQPEAEEALELAEQLAERYQVAVLPLDATAMDEEDIYNLLHAALYEFPIREVSVSLPRWVEELEDAHPLRQQLSAGISEAMNGVKKVRDIGGLIEGLALEGLTGEVALSSLELGSGVAQVAVSAADGLFDRVLSEIAGEDIEGEHTLLKLMQKYSRASREWNKMAQAMEEVYAGGYGVVTPRIDEMYLEEPELIKQGGHFGVRLRASAPSYHIIRTNISTEITPLIGTEKQCEELVRYITNEFEDDPAKIWDTNVFGKSLHELVQEGISGKLCRMPEQAQVKLADTLQRIVNESGGGLICIIV
ncbi:MAG: stage IV sporulation protein A [Bacillota bacterium]|nr:stage IV sporulation protein A [Bacillota bacterium]